MEPDRICRAGLLWCCTWRLTRQHRPTGEMAALRLQPSSLQKSVSSYLQCRLRHQGRYIHHCSDGGVALPCRSLSSGSDIAQTSSLQVVHSPLLMKSTGWGLGVTDLTFPAALFVSLLSVLYEDSPAKKQVMSWALQVCNAFCSC